MLSKRQRRTLHNDKGNNPTSGYSLRNIYVLKIGTPEYVKQILRDRKRETDRDTVIVGDFNTPLTSLDRCYRQKINKDTAALNDTPDQMDLIDIFRAFHLKTAEYTFFSHAHGKFSRIDHMLGHRMSQEI